MGAPRAVGGISPEMIGRGQISPICEEFSLDNLSPLIPTCANAERGKEEQAHRPFSTRISAFFVPEESIPSKKTSGVGGRGRQNGAHPLVGGQLGELCAAFSEDN